METDVILNLEDPRTKHIAEAITNKTSKKVLRELTIEDMSTSEISKKLNLPINTVDYNIKKLIQAGLIERKSFFWSPKGKKIHVYGISNKKIIINPKTFGGKGNYLLAFLITGIISFSMRFFKIFQKAGEDMYVETFALDLKSSFSEIAQRSSEQILYESQKAGIALNLGPFDWFLIGSWFAIILLILISFFQKRGKRVKL